MKDWKVLLSDLEGTLVRREKELEALRELDRSIASEARTLEETYDLILKYVAEFLDAPYASILIRRKNEIEIVASKPQKAMKEKLPLHDSVSGKCIIDAKVINCGNVHTDDFYSKIYQPMLGDPERKMISEIVAPMRVGDTIIGAINVESPNEDAFDLHDEALLETLAGQAAIAFQRVKLYDDIAFFHDIQAKTLFSLTNEVGIEAILRQALSKLEFYLGPQKYASFLFVDGNDLIVVYSTESDAMGLRVPILDSVSGVAVQEKKTQIIPDVTQHSRYKKISGRSTISEMVVPIKLQYEVIGVINLESEKQDEFDEFSKFVTENFARQIATIILPLKLRFEVESHKEREQAQAILLAIGSQTSNFIHQLNNVVGAIRVWAEEIQLDCREELTKNELLSTRIAKIQSNALEALQMPKDMRKQITELEEVDVNLEIKKQLGKINIPDKIEVVRYLGENLPKPKASFFGLVMSNLINNGIEAMPRGGTLTVTTELIEFEKLNDRRIKIVVKDTGIGIEKDMQRKIFNMGYQAKKESKGIGFGLWWVKTFIKRVGGDIELRSKPGQGTEFEIRLPL